MSPKIDGFEDRLKTGNLGQNQVGIK